MSTPETLAAWTLAAMVEAELAAFASRRPLSRVERAATTDFEAMDAHVRGATEAARPWIRGLLQTGAEVILTHVFPPGGQAVAADAAAQLADLAARVVERAQPALARVRPAVRTALAEVWETGATAVLGELGRQGAPVAGWLVPTAPATVEKLAETIATHPLLRQLERASRYVNDPARALAGQVTRAQLEELLGSTSEGASVDVMHQGLRATLAMSRWSTVLTNGGGTFLTAYSSEILDDAVCPACAAVDGKRYDTLQAAIDDYPLGGYLDCRGGSRCRGLLVWVYAPPGVAAVSDFASG